MRTKWWMTLASSLALGCTGSGIGQGGPIGSGLAQQGAPQGMGMYAGAMAPGMAPTSYGQQTPPSTWGRFVDAVTPGSATAPASTGPNAADLQRRQQLDPLSLSRSASTPSPSLYMSMAELCERGGNPDQARDLYRKALALDSEQGPALLGLARLEDRAGNLDEALQLYHRAAAAQPDDARVLNDLALCYARAGELPRSLGLLDRTTRLDPRNVLYRNNIAKVLVEMNLLNDAVTHQMAVHPPSVAQYNIGALLQQRGRSAEAVQFLSAALTADPTLTPAQELLQELKSAHVVAQSAARGAAALPNSVAPQGESMPKQIQVASQPQQLAMRPVVLPTTPSAASNVGAAVNPHVASRPAAGQTPALPDFGVLPTPATPTPQGQVGPTPMLLPPVQ